MPTYDYECDACGHALEVFQGINDPIKKKCPQCGKSKLRRLFGTGAAIVFKGSGFYQTDYRSEGYKKAAKADQTSSSETKSDSSSASGEGAKSAESSKAIADAPSKPKPSSPGGDT